LRVRFKPHALARFKEREIMREHVERVLASPVETIEVRFMRRATFANVNGRHLLVVYQADADELEVITAFWINQEGLRRYGFTRI